MGRFCPEFLHQMWFQWRSELPLLMEKLIPCCYHPKGVRIAFKQLHGFSDASEQAYAGVVYLRMVDSTGQVHTSLVIAKTKVAPVKRLSIPRLELCGAQLLAQLLHHCQRVFGKLRLGRKHSHHARSEANFERSLMW